MICDRCGQPAVKSLGALWFCAGGYLAAVDVLAPGFGFGAIIGTGAGWPADLWDLACPVCGATWVGPMLDACRWCAAREKARAAAIDRVPRPVGDCGLVCDVCGWRWNGLHAEACRRGDRVVCNGRGSYELAEREMRRARRI